MISKIFDAAELVPRAWLERAPASAIVVCNPAILRVIDRLVMTYVVRLPDGTTKIAMCRLRDDWTVAGESISAVSDLLTYSTSAVADTARLEQPANPRLIVLAGRLYMYFDTGPVRKPIRTCLVEIDAATLHPVGFVRIVGRTGAPESSQTISSFFARDNDLFAIYRPAPLTILRADVSDPHRVTLRDAYRHQWDSSSYEDTYGALVAAATPMLHHGRYYVLAHSHFADVADGPPAAKGTQCGVGAIIVFSGVPPFTPESVSAHPVIELGPAERNLPHRSDVDRHYSEDAYPAGLAADDRGLILSYGVNDRHAAVRRMDWQALAAMLIPAVARSSFLPPADTWLRGDVPSGTAVGAADPIAQDQLVVRGFWWRPGRVSPRTTDQATSLAQHRFVHGNFGDLFAPHLLGRLTGAAPEYHADNPKLITVGSVIRTAREGDVLWGTGLNGAYPQMLHAPKELHVYATRGPISHDFLKRAGFDVSRVTAVFDPGSLIDYLFQDEIAALRRDIGNPPRDFILIPHFRDDTVMRQLYPQYADNICPVDAPFFETVQEILRSNLVITSSLHGLIVAEALGVPAVWHRSLMGVDDLKFMDYYLGTGRYRIVKVDTLQAGLKASPMPLPTLDAAGMLATFPSLIDLDGYGVVVRPGADQGV